MIEHLPKLFNEAELTGDWSLPLKSMENLLIVNDIDVMPDWLAMELVWLAVQFDKPVLQLDEGAENKEVMTFLMAVKKRPCWQQVIAFNRHFPLLDQQHLLAQGVDIEIKTLSQFLAHPKSKQLSPHPLFNCMHYKNSEQIHQSPHHPLVHFFRQASGYQQKSPVPNQYFDCDWYRQRYQKKPLLNNPLLHYLQHCQEPGTQPNPHFHNDYVRRTQNLPPEADPLTYYLTQIKSQGVKFYLAGFSPCPYFDRAFYLSKNQDVRTVAEQGKMDPFFHFFALGIKEGRIGHPWLRERIVSPAMIEDFQATKRTAVLILGMHRSGTSALTRVISLSGMDLGTNLMEANEANETGYWESIELATIHDDLFHSLGSSWDSVLPLHENLLQSELVNHYKTLLTDYIVREFNSSARFVIKDPRICRLTPLWLDVLDKLNVQVKIIIPFRHPIEVAKSLQKRDGFLLEKSYLLWLRHALASERYTRGLARCFVSYSQLLATPQQVVETITRCCGIEGINSVDNQIEQFIDTRYYHQKLTETDLQEANLSNWILATYRLFTLLSEDMADEQSYRNQLDDISASMTEADKLFAKLIIGNKDR